MSTIIDQKTQISSLKTKMLTEKLKFRLLMTKKNPNFELKTQNVDQKTQMSTIID